MNQKQLEEQLDIRLNDAIEFLRLEGYASMNRNSFNGAVAGFLLKTGIHLAAQGKVDAIVLRAICDKTIEEAYK